MLSWRVAENFEVEPSNLHARDVLASGKIGDVAFFRLSGVNHVDVKTNQYARTTWRATPEYQGGFLLDGGVVSSDQKCSMEERIVADRAYQLIRSPSILWLSSAQSSQ